MEERRRFLAFFGSAAATTGLCALGCGGEGGASQPTGTIAAGKATDFSVGSLKKIADKQVLVGRDAQGVYAMTAICTHEQCDMSGSSGAEQATGIECTCHSSVFDLAGNPVAGPAKSPLQHFAVTIASDGAVAVNASSNVAATTRTAVPA